MRVHFGAYLFLLLFPFQLSFFLGAKQGLFLLFPFAFIFTSLVTHICFSVIENKCSSLPFWLFKQGTPRHCQVKGSQPRSPKTTGSRYSPINAPIL